MESIPFFHRKNAESIGNGRGVGGALVPRRSGQHGFYPIPEEPWRRRKWSGADARCPKAVKGVRKGVFSSGKNPEFLNTPFYYGRPINPPLSKITL